MVEDARRFVLRNRAIIEEAPLQTYVSALVFSPAESPIRECYLHQVPAWVNRLPATDVGWGSCVQNLQPNGHSIAIAFSPDGRFLACSVKGDYHGGHVIQLWDAATGALHSTLEGHQDLILSIAFLHDGTLVSHSRDKTLRVWEPVTGTTRHILDECWGATDADVVDEVDEVDDVFEAEKARSKTGKHDLYTTSSSLWIMPNGDLAILCWDQNIQIWSWENRSFSAPVNRGLVVAFLFGCLSPGILVFGTLDSLYLCDPGRRTIPSLLATGLSKS